MKISQKVEMNLSLRKMEIKRRRWADMKVCGFNRDGIVEDGGQAEKPDMEVRGDEDGLAEGGLFQRVPGREIERGRVFYKNTPIISYNLKKDPFFFL